MAFREIVGLVLIVVALVITPVAWVSSRTLWFVAFGMFFVGAWLLFSDRVLQRIDKSRRPASGDQGTGNAMPNDIHNYTGWRSGGRSESMDAGPHGAGGEGD